MIKVVFWSLYMKFAVATRLERRFVVHAELTKAIGRNVFRDEMREVGEFPQILSVKITAIASGHNRRSHDSGQDERAEQD